MLLERLQKQPEEFNFFQAVRLLEHAYHEFNDNKLRDFVCFKSASHNDFPLGAIESINLEAAEDKKVLPTVIVQFLGLTGINAGLPAPYTENILHLIHEQNLVPKDFFDIFNHLFILSYYEAWKKSHFYLVDFKNKKEDYHYSTFDLALLGIAGDLSQNEKQEDIDFICLKYASLFSGRQRSAVALESILQDYFEIPFQVLVLQGKWLILTETDKTVLATCNTFSGRYQKLGTEIILGQKYWNIDCHFRLYIGPIHYQDFQDLHPAKKLLKQICTIVKRYSKPEQSFDIQFELIAAEVPDCVLQQQNSMQLGWNTWLKTRPLVQNSKAVIVKSL